MRAAVWLAPLLFLVAMMSTACGAATHRPTAAPPAAGTTGPTASAIPAGTSDSSAALANVPGVVDPTNHGWPRQVQGLNGRVTITAKPQRIHTVSLGYDEVTFALLPAKRVVAVGSYTQKPDYSNVADLAQGITVIARDPEQIVAQHPDIVIADPFTKPELMHALENAGITVVQTELHNTPEGRIQDILFLGYVYGEEARAAQLATEVQSRYEALKTVTQSKPMMDRPAVLSLTSNADKLYVAGRDSTEGSIIEAAGGINAAARAGVEGNQTASFEGLVAMAPDIMIIPQADGGAAFKQQLLSNPALARVPAIRTGRVYLVPPKYFITISFWNIRGVEELAKLLWPQDFGAKEFPAFSVPKGHSQ